MTDSRKKSIREFLRRLVHLPYFDLIATLLAILIVVASLYAYSGNWPPMVVVESNSMQHGSGDVLGIINTGDIVLVKSVDVPSGVNTYVSSEPTGYSTYGELGDVIVYHANGDSTSVPVIHRAILWLDWNPASSSYSAPSLFSLKCSQRGDYVTFPTGGSPSNPVCPSSPNAQIQGNIDLYHIGWQSAVVTISLDQLASNPSNHYSGFITMGDNNFQIPGVGNYDQNGNCIISCIVEPSWVVGVARGMLPWFGALKLWISGETNCYGGPQGQPEGQCVPQASWDYLALCIALIIVLPMVVPWGVRKLQKKLRDGRQPQEPPIEEIEPPQHPET
jgi:signal peptidase